MIQRSYDVVVVGAGPAGLSAARTAARLGFRTLVLEQSSRAGQQNRAASCAVLPIPGFASGVRREDGSLYFPSLDLLIGSDLVLGVPDKQRFVSPNGHEFQAVFASRDDFPVAAVDKSGLLEQMAGQARTAGAEMAYGQRVTGLLRERGRICGVTTASGEQIRADVVMSAEGAGGGLVDQAGLFHNAAKPERWATVVSAELEGPEAGSLGAGQIVTLGRRYSSAANGFGRVFVPGQGRASVSFTVFSDGDQPLPLQVADLYLDEYMRADPRVRELFAKARVIGRGGWSWPLRNRPVQLVQNGFMGLGDAVSPGGQVGVLPAVYMGRQAALIAAEAIEGGDSSAECLGSYQQTFFGPLFNRLETEGEIMVRLAGLNDEELDRLCQALGRLNLGTPFFGNWRTVAWETLGWMVRQYPLVMREWDVLERVLQLGDANGRSVGRYVPVVPVGMAALGFAQGLSAIAADRGTGYFLGDG